MDLSDKKEMLIRDLKEKGYLRSRKVEEAMREVPREVFVDPDQELYAYSDQPLHIGSGQTISAPHMVAVMTELLEPGKGDRVLEVGGGSGYQAAVLSRLVKRVYSVELESGLVNQARRNLREAGIENVEVIRGDGSLGLPDEAPFDKIIVTCGSDSLYPAWEQQLREGGILLVPLDSGTHQELTLARKREGKLVARGLMDVVFVPLRH
jgi:protein-L-isoaspartate(D-aspartate) O-methyltransferase